MTGRTAEREAMNDVINVPSTQLSQVIRQDGIMASATVSLLPVCNLNDRANNCLNKRGRLFIDYVRLTLE